MLPEVQNEVKLFATLIRGAPEFRAYILKNILPEHINYIRKAWEIITARLAAQEALPSGEALAGIDELKETAEAGFIESSDHVPLIT